MQKLQNKNMQMAELQSFSRKTLASCAGFAHFPPPWPQGAHATGVLPNRPSTGWKGERDERTRATGDGLGFPEREPDL